MFMRPLWMFFAILSFISKLCSTAPTKSDYPDPFSGPLDYSNAPQMPLCNGVQIEEASITELQSFMESGALTSKQIVGCYLQRMHLVDRNLKSILELNPDVLSIADQLDQERAAGKIRGIMHGIPVAVKDNIASLDSMQTTAGSYALLGSRVPRDAHVVKMLRENGAIIFGKAGLSEWADMRSDVYSEGYSARGGQARNCFNLSQNPGGSSTGSANAVSANIVTVAYGTETDGSVISPASKSGIVGFKPTVGLTSRAGVIPESAHQDTVGTFGKSVKDAVIALDAIFGPDPRDNYTLAQHGMTQKNYTQFLRDKKALKGAKFGLPWRRIWNSTSVHNQLPYLLDVIKIIEAAGATVYNNTEYLHIEEIVSPDGWDWDYGPTNQSEYTRVKVDFYNNIASYLSELKNTTIRTLSDIIAFNIRDTSVEGGQAAETAAFKGGQEGFIASEQTNGAYDALYYTASAWLERTSKAEGVDYALTHQTLDFHTKKTRRVQLDALLQPSDGYGPGTNTPAQAGYPLLTLPVGLDPYHVPFAISIVGSAWSEPMLVMYGSAIEDALDEVVKRRIKPTFYNPNAENIPVDVPFGV